MFSDTKLVSNISEVDNLSPVVEVDYPVMVFLPVYCGVRLLLSQIGSEHQSIRTKPAISDLGVGVLVSGDDGHSHDFFSSGMISRSDDRSLHNIQWRRSEMCPASSSLLACS